MLCICYADRRRIYPTDDVLAEVDVDLWRRGVNYLTLCLCFLSIFGIFNTLPQSVVLVIPNRDCQWIELQHLKHKG